MAIGARLLAWIGGGTSLVLAAALAFTLITKGAEVRSLTKANAALAERLANERADLAQCRSNGTALAGAIKAQGAAILAMGAAGERRAAGMAIALDRAESASSAARSASERILRATAAGDVCEAADRLMLEEAD